jgi:hypothetical protein
MLDLANIKVIEIAYGNMHPFGGSVLCDSGIIIIIICYHLPLYAV